MIEERLAAYLERYLQHDSAEEAALDIIELLQEVGAVLPGYELVAKKS